MLKSNIKRGDTIVEVIFGFAIFGFVAISVITLMNNGLARGQLALETTLVRNQMDSQAEALRLIHQSALLAKSTKSTQGNVMYNNWQLIKSKNNPNLKPLSLVIDKNSCMDITKFNQNAFAIDVRSNFLNVLTNLTNAKTYSRLIYGDLNDNNVISKSKNLLSVQGVWIDVKKINPGSGEKAYYDFYIRSCWSGPSSKVPTTLETIVRLYDFE